MHLACRDMGGWIKNFVHPKVTMTKKKKFVLDCSGSNLDVPSTDKYL